MKFMMYDIGLLVIFVIFIGIFLYRKRKNLKKEGFLLLYRTSWGMKIIDKIGKKFTKTLSFLSYVVIGLGYLLMVFIIYMFGKIVWVYVLNPEIVRAIKIPPIMPLIPYLPQVFKLDFLPPFYFTYWILIIAIVAIPHEFFHGIFMKRHGIKIKSTGFGFFPFFLPIFLAAFVEQDEKSMKEKKIFPQMSVLAAGTFANILTGIFFFIIMWLFFSLAFVPAGISFDTYTYSAVAISAISSINGVPLENASYENLVSSINETGLNEITADGEKFFLTKDFLEQQQDGEEYVLLYDNTPAVNAGLEGVITHLNGVKITSMEKIEEELMKYSPGDEISITTLSDDEEKEYLIILGENPDNENIPYIGIGFINQKASGVLGRVVSGLSSFKKSNVYYESKFEAGIFIYNLLWWIILISFSIALINMLPVGIFDGGRFFYLTILAITKSEKKAKKAFSFITYFFLVLLFVIMAFWLISWFR